MHPVSPTLNGLTAILSGLNDLKVPNAKVEEHHGDERKRLQKAFGYTYEEIYEGYSSHGSKTAASLSPQWAVTSL